MLHSLVGARIAVAESRQLGELSALLHKEQAIPLPYPMLSIIDAPDAAPVEAWLNALIAGKFDLVVFLTGEGIRRLLDFAQRAGLRAAFVDALARPRIIARGPKPVRELKNLDLNHYRIAHPPTTEGVIAALHEEPLQGKTVGVQFYAPDNPLLLAYLTEAGATPATVLPYVYAPASDSEKVCELIDAMAGGSIDIIVFTSSPQIDRLFEIARITGREDKLIAGLAYVVVVSVGPVVAETLSRYNVHLDVCPPQGFVMKNMIQQLKRHLERT